MSQWRGTTEPMTITRLTAASHLPFGKRFDPQGKSMPTSAAHWPPPPLTAYPVELISLTTLEDVVQLYTSCGPQHLHVRGTVTPPVTRLGRADVLDVPQRWVAVDYDGSEDHTTSPQTLAGDAIAARQALPPSMRSRATLAVATGSAGMKPGIRLRLWQIWDEPVTCAQLRALCTSHPHPAIDLGFFTPWRLNYIQCPTGPTPYPTLESRMHLLPPTTAIDLSDPEIPVGERDNALYAYVRHVVAQNPRTTLDELIAATEAYAADTIPEPMERQSYIIRQKAQAALKSVKVTLSIDTPIGACGPKHRRSEKATKKLISELLPDGSNLAYIYAQLHTEFEKGHMPAAEMARILHAEYPDRSEEEHTQEILKTYTVAHPKPAVYAALETLDDGSIPSSDFNVRALLQSPLFAFEYDSQEDTIYVRKSPDHQYIPLGAWTNTHAYGLSAWAGNPANLLRWRGIKDKTQIPYYVQQIATQRVRLHDTLDMCAGQWDGISRINDLARTALGDASDIARLYMSTWLVQAVRRAYEPGTSAELVLVLTGGSSYGKTTFFQNLALKEEWYYKALGARPISKDTREVFRSKWIVVLDEFNDHANSHGALKSILSDRTVSYRPLYQPTIVTRPLWYTVGATTDTPLFIADSSGSRRFGPIHVSKYVEHPPPAQIWGEAVHMYRNGVLPYIDDKTLDTTTREAHRVRIGEALSEHTLWDAIHVVLDKNYCPSGAHNIHGLEVAPSHMFTPEAIASGVGRPHYVAVLWLLDKLGEYRHLHQDSVRAVTTALRNEGYTPTVRGQHRTWQRPEGR